MDWYGFEGFFLKIRALLAAAGFAGLGISACETPTYGTGGVIGTLGGTAAAGVLASIGDLSNFTTNQIPTARLEAASASRSYAAPPAVGDHEVKASALISGRQFLAGSKVLAYPATETPSALVRNTVPAGWRLNDNRLVHNDSGLECPLEFDFRAGGKGGVLALKDIAAYDQINRDVSCNYSNGGAAVITVYASFYPETSIEDHAAAAVSAMRQTFTLRAVLPVVSIEIEDKEAGTSTADLEAPIAGAFDIGDINGVPYKTSIWIAKTHGWHVKARATYAQADATSELVAAVIFAANYLNVDMKNKLKPTMPGPDV